RRSFEEAVHIFAANTEADDGNWRRMTDLRTRIARVNADRTIGGYAGVASNRFRGLQRHLVLAVGARVFINNNVWNLAGFANGAAGEVVHTQGAPHTQPPALPEVAVGGWVVDLRNLTPTAPIGAVDEHLPAECRPRATLTPKAVAFGRSCPLCWPSASPSTRARGRTSYATSWTLARRRRASGKPSPPSAGVVPWRTCSCSPSPCSASQASVPAGFSNHSLTTFIVYGSSQTKLGCSMAC
ncbi:unnamed protein product, partial [Hapterophycus canaliculatus]